MAHDTRFGAPSALSGGGVSNKRNSLPLPAHADTTSFPPPPTRPVSTRTDDFEDATSLPERNSFASTSTTASAAVATAAGMINSMNTTSGSSAPRPLSSVSSSSSSSAAVSAVAPSSCASFPDSGESYESGRPQVAVTAMAAKAAAAASVLRAPALLFGDATASTDSAAAAAAAAADDDATPGGVVGSDTAGASGGLDLSGLGNLPLITDIWGRLAVDWHAIWPANGGAVMPRQRKRVKLLALLQQRQRRVPLEGDDEDAVAFMRRVGAE